MFNFCQIDKLTANCSYVLFSTLVLTQISCSLISSVRNCLYFSKLKSFEELSPAGVKWLVHNSLPKIWTSALINIFLVVWHLLSCTFLTQWLVFDTYTEMSWHTNETSQNVFKETTFFSKSLQNSQHVNHNYSFESIWTSSTRESIHH